MYQFASQCDIMYIIRKNWGGSFPVGFEFPKTASTHTTGLLSSVSSKMVSPIHFEETVNFKVWSSGTDARKKAFNAGSELFEYLMNLRITSDNITGVDVLSAPFITQDPTLNIPVAEFTLVFYTVNDRTQQ